MSSGSNDIELDQFRQGIYARGYAVHRSMIPILGPEIDSFEIVQINFGQPKTFSDNTAFQDLANFDAVQYLNGDISPQCYPAILGNVNILDPSQMDGVIEPLSIKAKASMNSIEYPFASNDIRGALQDGNEDQFSRACKISQFSPVELPIIVVPFLDSEQLFGSTIAAAIRIPGYFSNLTAIISPFEENDAIEYEKLGVLLAGNDIIGALEPMNPNDDDLLPNNCRSAGAGFTYTNCVAGTDSITYGGLKR